MSATWRAAVDWHATTLNPITSSIFSLLADGADAWGVVRTYPNLIETLAHQSRTDERTVRKALETLVEAALLSRAQGRYLIDETILRCPVGDCSCPNPRIAPGTTQQLQPAPLAAQAPPSPKPARSEAESAILEDLTRCFEGAWRAAYKTEPTPGLLRKLAITIADEPSAWGLLHDAGPAFREYLRRVKDPMYLNLQKFASTWRVYLEPEKGRAADDNAADFAKVFARSTEILPGPGLIVDDSIPKDRAYLVPAGAIRDLMDPKADIEAVARSMGKAACRIVNIGETFKGDVDL